MLAKLARRHRGVPDPAVQDILALESWDDSFITNDHLQEETKEKEKPVSFSY